MCSHYLGTLPCLNAQPHEGHGRGCVHHGTVDDLGNPNDKHADTTEDQ
jgi:hypothetical protein